MSAPHGLGPVPVAAPAGPLPAADRGLAPLPADVWGPPDGPVRAWWKTLLGSVLWTLVPVVGWAVAVQWVDSRGRPERFDIGDALRTGLVWAGWMLLGLAGLGAALYGLAKVVGLD